MSLWALIAYDFIHFFCCLCVFKELMILEIPYLPFPLGALVEQGTKEGSFIAYKWGN